MSGADDSSGAASVRAVALRYDEGGPRAPQVVAKGIGDVAERLLEVAAKAGVPVREDADLVELLSACHLGDEIPEELYAVVAELLTWLYGINAALVRD